MEGDRGQGKLLGTSKTFEQDVQNTCCSRRLVDRLVRFVSAQRASI